MSEQVEQAVVDKEPPRIRFDPFLASDAPPVVTDPYSIPIEDINVIDGRLFQQEIHCIY